MSATVEVRVARTVHIGGAPVKPGTVVRVDPLQAAQLLECAAVVLVRAADFQTVADAVRAENRRLCGNTRGLPGALQSQAVPHHYSFAWRPPGTHH